MFAFQITSLIYKIHGRIKGPETFRAGPIIVHPNQFCPSHLYSTSFFARADYAFLILVIFYLFLIKNFCNLIYFSIIFHVFLAFSSLRRTLTCQDGLGWQLPPPLFRPCLYPSTYLGKGWRLERG